MSSASQGVVSAKSSAAGTREGRETREPIAVVGVSALMPGSSDASGYWRDVFEGNDRITDVPESHWLIGDYYDADPTKPDKTYAKRGAFLSPIEFDPMEFGVPPSIVPATDTSQLLSLVAAKRLLDDVAAGNVAGIDASKLDRSRMSVILGATSAQELVNQMASRLQKPIWVKALREQGLPEDEVEQICARISAEYTPWQESTFPGLLGNVIAGRIANRLDLGGTNCVTDAACASSFSALQMAVSELHLGDSDVAICGGVETLNDIFMFMCFSKTPALSLSGDIRPFSDKADGTMLGEGIALVALKRLSDAEKQGDRIYAVIKSVGTSSDGRAKSVYAPVPEGQAKALRRAYENAGYGPETVELVEGHGTGTKAGDAAELEGLRTVWGESDRAKSETQWCALGTVKAQVGHTKACAGAAGLLKAIFALHHKVLPPTIKIDAPNPAMKIEETAFYLNTAARPWVRGSDHPRRASVSSFGFGGSNFHVALEEYTRADRQRERLRAMPSELVVVVGNDGHDVAKQCRAMAADCTRDGMLVWFAHTSQVALRDASSASKKARLAIVATSEADLGKKLGDAAAKIEAAPATAFSLPSGLDYAFGSEPGKVAFLFPGQGSQYVGMGGDVAMAFDDARAVLDRAADHRFDGATVPVTIFPRPVFTDAARAAQTETLTRTEWAQPAIGVTSESLLMLAKSMSLTPDVVGGHSFGEVTALFAAGAIGEDGLLAVARLRGERMADAAATTKGAMAAIPRTIEEVRTILRALPKDLADAIVVANHNGPKQVVVSGATAAIETLVERLVDQGIHAKKLPVATAFHSPIVAGSSAPFRAALTQIAITSPKIPVFSNADAAPYATSPDAIRDTLAQQIAKPVRFVEQVRAMHAMGVRTFVEVGPQAVLTALVDECLSDAPAGSCRAIAMDRKGKNGVTALWSAIGKLVVAGVKVDVAALWDRYAKPVDPRTKKKPPMTLALSGTNYGKPYPPKGGSAALPKPNGPRPKPEPEIVVKEVIKEVVKEVVREVPVAASGARANASVAPLAPAATDAWSEVQRQTADAHATYLKAMADSHGRFLQVAEQAIAALSGHAVPTTTRAAEPPLPRWETPAPVAESRIPHREKPLPVAELHIPHGEKGVLAAESHIPHGEEPVHVAEPRVAATPSPVAIDLKPIMLAVVSDKTGYPAEMLTMEMALEADLGIDSIKRVEILSAMKDRVPNLPAFKASDMAALRTLGEIVGFMERQTQTSPPRPPSPEPDARARGERESRALDLKPIMLAVVSEKTGYPAEMLTMEMALEADLGIDSIKRVEILSAMKDRVPNLPAFKASDMAALRTLGEIVGFMESNAPQTSPPRPPSPEPDARARGERELAATDARIGRFSLREIDAPSRGGLGSLPSGLAVSVTDDGRGIAVALVAKLRQRGVNAQVVAKLEEGTRGAIVLAGLRALSTVDEAVAVNAEAFEAACVVGRAIAKEASAPALFVTVQATGGDFGLGGVDALRAWTGGLAGLTKTAAQEWAHVAKDRVRAIDLELGGRTAEVLAEAIAREVLDGGGDAIEIGLHADGRRTTLESFASSAPTGALAIDATSIVVASGGARGVTAATLVGLAKATKCTLVLLGRTALENEPRECNGERDEAGVLKALIALSRAKGDGQGPAELRAQSKRVMSTREVRETIARLESAGSKVRYVVADVTDGAAIARALDAVRSELGPITGVVHGAGVLADKLLSDKTRAQFDAVFDTKVGGLRALLHATERDPLRAIVLFSSVAGRCGNAGQSDYAMANEVLDKVASVEARRRNDACIVRAIGWGPWESGMVTPALKAKFAEMGVPLIPLEVGAAMMIDELRAGPDGDVEIVIGGEPRMEALVAPKAGSNGAATREYEQIVRLDLAGYPALDSHRIQGAVVVPAVLAIELMSHAAKHVAGGRAIAGLRDVRVVKGIRLATGANPSVDVKLVAKARNDREIIVEVRSLEGHLHYAATAEIAGATSATAPTKIEIPSQRGAPWTADDAYARDLLFHGPAFRAISSLDWIGDGGASAMIATSARLGWPSSHAMGAWAIDLALLDGGLQLARLWGIHAIGKTSLPTRIGELVVHSKGALPSELRCVLVPRSRDEYRTVTDLFFVDGAGVTVAELRGVEMHIVPSESPSVMPPSMQATAE